VLVSKTLSQEKAEADAVAKAAEEAEVAAKAQERADRPPLTASEQLAARIEATEIDQQRMERLRREVQDLQGRADRERAALDRERAAFAEEKRLFEAGLGRSMARAKDAQFRKTIEAIEAMKPKEALAVLRQMIPQTPLGGAGVADAADTSVMPDGTPRELPVSEAERAAIEAARAGKARVIEYLDAMGPDVRNKLLGELAKSDPELAEELLGKLRTFGLAPSGAGPSVTTTSAPNAASASPAGNGFAPTN
jgi:hypothetical protein